MASQQVDNRRAEASVRGTLRKAAGARGARRSPLPEVMEPQLASLAASAPRGEAWLHEIKFDGYRILAHVAGGDARLTSRNGRDWTERFPAIADGLGRLPADALLDGEVVALRSDGTSSFADLQRALSAGRTQRLSYQAFDLLHLGETDLREAALEDRKAALQALLGAAHPEAVRYTDHVRGQGPAFQRRACSLGLEGMVSKRADAPYRSGRSRAWLKVKCVRQLELLVGGFTEPSGGRHGFGALLLGAWRRGRLTYAGRVGTGFDARQLHELRDRLRPLEVDAPAFDPAPDERSGVHWVRPELVVEVAFAEWTAHGRLRQPSFRGVREDRDPDEIRLPNEDERRTARQAAADGASRRRPRATARHGQVEVAGVPLSHPERVLYPEQGVTKLALARYYREVAPWILPGLAGRPLALLRCPEGAGAACFFQKHPGASLAATLPRVAIDEDDGAGEYVVVERAADLVALVQAGTLELHPWGSRVDDLERPDAMIVDLDPGPEVPWRAVLDAARGLRARLADLDLHAFPRLTGGKGLHLVVPLEPRAGWPAVKAAAGAVAAAHAGDDPTRFTTHMAKARRRGRIYLDTLRNARGATAVASYSTRARPGAPVATPVRWDELRPARAADHYRVGTLERRLAALADDPWAGFEAARRPLDDDRLRALGIERRNGAAGASERS